MNMAMQGLADYCDILEAIAGSELSNNPNDLWTEQTEDGLLVDGLTLTQWLKNRLELSELEGKRRFPNIEWPLSLG